MKRLIFIVGVLSSVVQAHMNPDYRALFQKHVQFPGCSNEFAGVFESSKEGCLQVDAKLFVRPISSGEMTHELAATFCERLNEFAGRKGWRVPSKGETSGLHKALSFVANNLGLDLKQHAKTGLGILSFDLSKPIWAFETQKKVGMIRGQAGESLSWGGFPFAYRFNLSDGLGHWAPLFIHSGSFNYRDDEGIFNVPLDKPYTAHALCVRSLSEGEELEPADRPKVFAKPKAEESRSSLK